MDIKEERRIKNEENTEDIFNTLIPEEELCKKLYAHQREGITFLYNAYQRGKSKMVSRSGAILADEMGLGKSIQVILFLHSMIMNKHEFKNAMLVLPSTLMFDWERKLKRWTPKIKILMYHKSMADRSRRLKCLQMTGGVLLVSYRMFLYNFQELTSYKGTPFHWDCLIFDEAHKLKNTGAKTHKRAAMISATFCILITGTPMQNNLSEFWALFSLISDTHLLGTYKTFKTKFENPITRGMESDATAKEKALGIKLQEILEKKTEPFYLRRRIDEIQAPKEQTAGEDMSCEQVLQLPGKNEYVMWIKLSPEQKAAYGKITGAPGCTLDSIHFLLAVCTHPRLPDETKPLEMDDVHLAESGKLVFLLSLLETLSANGHFVLVFSNYIKNLDIIQLALTQTTWGQKAFLRIDGQRDKGRDKIITQFQKRKSQNILLLSTTVGAEGLTLTAADCVVFADISWNQCQDAQAVGRAHRIGQTRDIKTFRLITCGTLEEAMYRRQLFRSSLTRQVVGDDPNPLRHFTQNELKAILILQETQFSLTQQQLIKQGAKCLDISDIFGHDVSSISNASVCGISDHGQLLSASQGKDLDVDMAKMHITETAKISQQDIETESHLKTEPCFNVSIKKPGTKGKIHKKTFQSKTPGLPRKYKCFSPPFSGKRKKTKFLSRPCVFSSSDSSSISTNDEVNLCENSMPHTSFSFKSDSTCHDSNTTNKKDNSKALAQLTHISTSDGNRNSDSLKSVCEYSDSHAYKSFSSDVHDNECARVHHKDPDDVNNLSAISKTPKKHECSSSCSSALSKKDSSTPCTSNSSDSSKLTTDDESDAGNHSMNQHESKQLISNITSGTNESGGNIADIAKLTQETIREVKDNYCTSFHSHSESNINESFFGDKIHPNESITVGINLQYDVGHSSTASASPNVPRSINNITHEFYLGNMEKALNQHESLKGIYSADEGQPAQVEQSNKIGSKNTEHSYPGPHLNWDISSAESNGQISTPDNSILESYSMGNTSNYENSSDHKTSISKNERYKYNSPENTCMGKSETSHLHVSRHATESNNISSKIAISSVTNRSVSDVNLLQCSDHNKSTDHENVALSTSQEVKIINDKKVQKVQTDTKFEMPPFSEDLPYSRIVAPSSESKKNTTLNQEDHEQLLDTCSEINVTCDLSLLQVVPELCETAVSAERENGDTKTMPLEASCKVTHFKQGANVTLKDTREHQNLVNYKHEQTVCPERPNLMYNSPQNKSELNLGTTANKSCTEALLSFENQGLQLSDIGSEESFKYGLTSKPSNVTKEFADYSLSQGCISLPHTPSVKSGKRVVSDNESTHSFTFYQSTPLKPVQTIQQGTSECLKKYAISNFLPKCKTPKGKQTGSEHLKKSKKSSPDLPQKYKCFSSSLPKSDRIKSLLDLPGNNLNNRCQVKRALVYSSGVQFTPMTNKEEENIAICKEKVNILDKSDHYSMTSNANLVQQSKVSLTPQNQGKENQVRLLPVLCDYSLTPSAISPCTIPQTEKSKPVCTYPQQPIGEDTEEKTTQKRSPNTDTEANDLQMKVKQCLLDLLANSQTLSSKRLLSRKTLTKPVMPKQRLKKRRKGLSFKSKHSSFSLSYRKQIRKVLKSKQNVYMDTLLCGNTEIKEHAQEGHLRECENACISDCTKRDSCTQDNQNPSTRTYLQTEHRYCPNLGREHAYTKNGGYDTSEAIRTCSDPLYSISEDETLKTIAGEANIYDLFTDNQPEMKEYNLNILEDGLYSFMLLDQSPKAVTLNQLLDISKTNHSESNRSEDHDVQRTSQDELLPLSHIKSSKSDIHSEVINNQFQEEISFISCKLMEEMPQHEQNSPDMYYATSFNTTKVPNRTGQSNEQATSFPFKRRTDSFESRDFGQSFAFGSYKDSFSLTEFKDFDEQAFIPLNLMKEYSAVEQTTVDEKSLLFASQHENMYSDCKSYGTCSSVVQDDADIGVNENIDDILQLLQDLTQ